MDDIDEHVGKVVVVLDLRLDTGPDGMDAAVVIEHHTLLLS